MGPSCHHRPSAIIQTLQSNRIPWCLPALPSLFLEHTTFTQETMGWEEAATGALVCFRVSLPYLPSSLFSPPPWIQQRKHSWRILNTHVSLPKVGAVSCESILELSLRVMSRNFGKHDLQLRGSEVNSLRSSWAVWVVTVCVTLDLGPTVLPELCLQWVVAPHPAINWGISWGKRSTEILPRASTRK